MSILYYDIYVHCFRLLFLPNFIQIKQIFCPISRFSITPFEQMCVLSIRSNFIFVWKSVQKIVSSIIETPKIRSNQVQIVYCNMIDSIASLFLSSQTIWFLFCLFDFCFFFFVFVLVIYRKRILKTTTPHKVIDLVECFRLVSRSCFFFVFQFIYWKSFALIENFNACKQSEVLRLFTILCPLFFGMTFAEFFSCFSKNCIGFYRVSSVESLFRSVKKATRIRRKIQFHNLIWMQNPYY